MEPHEARQFVKDLRHGMDRRAFTPCRRGERDWPTADEPSLQRELYGDAWKFFFGVRTGISEMQLDPTGYSWEQEYEKFGRGPHGRGMKVGKKLAFFEDREFTFSEPDESESKEFTFIGDGSEEDSKFTFVQ